ncbi:uncharacterized protein LOC113347258 [Papaver somniferum]|uniref:uncharacterized protein LOC113347258 n=1 Tax=Papaver somniferum TaxID=3469 RepID=UPI000E6F9DA3|nr:uncharacterized protein LOC113347258 [Papaver somniferum]XP_026446663.1 uncharacterized protein LOC113347258 [Papaver somniferum]
MQVYSWKKPCKDHAGGVVCGPFNGIGADFLIYGTDKPTPQILVYLVQARPVSNNNIPASVGSTLEDSSLGLSVEILSLVYQKQITTISSIPPQCRLNFSRTLKSSLDRVITHPKDLCSWLQLLILPICTLRLYFPKNSKEEGSGNRKRLQTASVNQALARWNEPHGCIDLLQQVLQEHREVQKSRKQSKQKRKTNVEACKKNLSQGLYTAAVRILSSSGVAYDNPDTLYQLQHKHPHAPPPTIPTDTITAASVVVGSNAVLKEIRSFPKGTSCGRDGLRAQHLLDALSGPAAAVSEEFLTSIAGVVNLWLSGVCTAVLGPYIASAPLTPLLKPDGGLRPIAVGTIWRRLCSKIAATSVGSEMANYLGDYQFGVGIPCGGESILHAANKIMELKGAQNTITMMLVDFANAFNLVDRTSLISEVRARCPGITRWVEFCYAQPARLYYNDYILASVIGVQQGDPLGPLLFALVLHPLVHKIAAHCSLDMHAWYLDDGTIIGDTLEVSKSLKIIQQEGDSRGLHLNIRKTEIFWPAADPRSLMEDVLPANISKPYNGVKVL